MPVRVLYRHLNENHGLKPLADWNKLLSVAVGARERTSMWHVRLVVLQKLRKSRCERLSCYMLLIHT